MLPHLAHTAHQLYAATSDNFSFQWTPTLQKAFEAKKDMLKKDILLINIKGTSKVKVYIDASEPIVRPCVFSTQFTLPHTPLAFCLSF